jgi:hypothetical protein
MITEFQIKPGAQFMEKIFQKWCMLFGLVVMTAAAYADTRVVLISPVPAPREMAVVPGGYEKCYVVESGWYRGRWVPTHRVCHYHHQNLYYWRCDRYSTNTGVCRAWFWVPSHWSR